MDPVFCEFIVLNVWFERHLEYVCVMKEVYWMKYFLFVFNQSLYSIALVCPRGDRRRGGGERA